MIEDIELEQRGFVLPTSLVMMLLMTVLSIGVYYGVSVSQSTSVSAKSSTAAFYYAETAVNYISWALKNDAEFDSYTYPQPVKASGEKFFAEPDVRPGLFDPYAVGDRTEWLANMGNPSGEDSVTGVFDGVDHYGQLMYFDNSPLATRAVCYDSSAAAPSFSCTRLALVLDNIHVNAPRYIRLDIDSYGQITPALPPYSATAPHHGSVVGVDIPKNGAIIWLTGGNLSTDLKLYPIDLYAAPFNDKYSNAIVTSSSTANPPPVPRAPWLRDATGTALVGTPLQDWLGRLYPDPLGAYYDNFPCDIYAMDKSNPSGKDYRTLVACVSSTTPAKWVQSMEYGLVAYAVGYVDGRARKIIRVVLK